MAIVIEGGINIDNGILITSPPAEPPSPAVTFGTPAIMNSGAFVSLLQPNSIDIDPSGLIAVVGQMAAILVVLCQATALHGMVQN